MRVSPSVWATSTWSRNTTGFLVQAPARSWQLSAIPHRRAVGSRPETLASTTRRIQLQRRRVKSPTTVVGGFWKTGYPLARIPTVAISDLLPNRWWISVRSPIPACCTIQTIGKHPGTSESHAVGRGAGEFTSKVFDWKVLNALHSSGHRPRHRSSRGVIYPWSGTGSAF